MSMNDEIINKLDSLAKECRELANLPLHVNSHGEFSESEDDILEAAKELKKAVEKR